MDEVVKEIRYILQQRGLDVCTKVERETLDKRELLREGSWTDLPEDAAQEAEDEARGVIMDRLHGSGDRGSPQE